MQYTNASVQIIQNYSHPKIKFFLFSREIAELKVKFRKKREKTNPDDCLPLSLVALGYKEPSLSCALLRAPAALTDTSRARF